MDPPLDSLHALAEACGVYLTYYDVTGRLCQASPEALVSILQTLGVAIEKPDQSAEALRQHRQQAARKLLEPVALAWDGKPPDLTFQLPSKTSGAIACRLVLENGGIMSWSCPLECLPVAEESKVEGVA